MNAESTIDVPISSDLEQIAALFPISGGETLIELGCGPAETTRLLAERFPDLKIIATEVDHVQLGKNLDSSYPPNLSFQYGSAEDIKMPDSSVEFVMMLKSLHHVPVELMARSLKEIRRVLVPGGLAYISEPVCAGDLNDIVRIFHDEKKVRQAAIDALAQAVAAGEFQQVKQIHFSKIWTFEGFADFENQIIGATHTEFNIDEQLRKRIESAFATFVEAGGIAEFRSPRRVDLFRLPI